MPDGSPAKSVVAYRVLRQASLSVVKPPAAADTVITARSTGSGVGVAVGVGVGVGVGAGPEPSHAPASAGHRRAAASSGNRRVQTTATGLIPWCLSFNGFAVQRDPWLHPTCPYVH